MTTPVAPAFATQLKSHLEAELAVHRRLMVLAERQQRLLVTVDMPAYATSVEQAQNLLTEASRLRQLRDRLVHGLAGLLGIKDREFQLGLLLSRLPEAIRPPIIAIQSELKQVLERLRQLNDANTLLIRQGLGLARDLMTVLLGDQRPASAYDRRGTNGVAIEGRGAIINIRG